MSQFAGSPNKHPIVRQRNVNSLGLPSEVPAHVKKALALALLSGKF
jgi:hypothetical protein